LILCKEFVAMHEGMLWAESTPGQGTAFFVALPVHGPAGGDEQSMDDRD
jgi:signal transduction histidine kinase